MKTHLPGIHNTSIFSQESKDFQTLNNGSAEGSMAAATADHLMLAAASKNSNSVNVRSCLGFWLVNEKKSPLNSMFSSKGGKLPWLVHCVNNEGLVVHIFIFFFHEVSA